MATAITTNSPSGSAFADLPKIMIYYGQPRTMNKATGQYDIFTPNPKVDAVLTQVLSLWYLHDSPDNISGRAIDRKTQDLELFTLLIADVEESIKATKIPKQHETILFAHLHHGHPIKNIGQVLNVSAAAVRYRYKTAYLTLARYLHVVKRWDLLGTDDTSATVPPIIETPTVQELIVKQRYDKGLHTYEACIDCMVGTPHVSQKGLKYLRCLPCRSTRYRKSKKQHID